MYGGTYLHHENDVVFDEQDREVLFGENAQELREILRLPITQTRCRLVEQQHARPRGQGPTQLAEAGETGRQGVGAIARNVA